MAMHIEPTPELNSLDNAQLKEEISRTSKLLRRKGNGEIDVEALSAHLDRAADLLEERRKKGRERSVKLGQTVTERGRRRKGAARDGKEPKGPKAGGGSARKGASTPKAPPIDEKGPVTYERVLLYFKFLFGEKGMRALRAFNRAGNTWEFGDVWGDLDIDWKDSAGEANWIRVNVQIEEDISPVEAAILMMQALEETRVYWHHGLTDDQIEDWQKFFKAYLTEMGKIAAAGAEFELAILGLANEGADWTMTIDEVSQGNLGAIFAMLPFVTVGMVKIVDKTGKLAALRRGQLQVNKTVGDAFEKHVYETKLKGVDNVGRLRKQEEFLDYSRPMEVRRPDWQIWDVNGDIAAICDAKSGLKIELDAQAREFVHSACNGRLIYYVPKGKGTKVAPELFDYAKEFDVKITIIEVPWDPQVDITR